MARPAAKTPTEFFARTAYPEPVTLRAVPDLDGIDKIIEEQLGQRL